MSASPSRSRDAVAWAVPRLWILATAFAVGVVAAGVGIAVLTALGNGDPTAAADTVFALGTLLFGFGLLGWSGSVMAGRGFEAMQEFLDTGTEWTEADSRRAMARITGFGFGLMVGTPLLSGLVGSLGI